MLSPQLLRCRLQQCVLWCQRAGEPSGKAQARGWPGLLTEDGAPRGAAGDSVPHPAGSSARRRGRRRSSTCAVRRGRPRVRGVQQQVAVLQVRRGVENVRCVQPWLGGMLTLPRRLPSPANTSLGSLAATAGRQHGCRRSSALPTAAPTLTPATHCSETGWCGLEASHCGGGCRGGPCWRLEETASGAHSARRMLTSRWVG